MIEHENNATEHHHTSQGQSVFDTPEMFVEKFDGPERDQWQKPDEVIASFNLPPDATVVEVGAGTGYFAVRLAEHVRNGKIITFDQSKNMASYLGNRVRELGLTNVESRVSEADGSLQMQEQADLIFSVDVYHHLQDRVAYFSKLSGHLKPDGVLAIIDRTEEKVEGQPTGHRVPAGTVKKEMREAGFELVNEFDFLLPIQYYLTFKRAS